MRNSWPYNRDGDELYDELFQVASFTECTGLMPTPPIDNSEVDSYLELYDSPFSDGPRQANHHYQTASKKDDHDGRS